MLTVNLAPVLLPTVSNAKRIPNASYNKLADYEVEGSPAIERHATCYSASKIQHIHTLFARMFLGYPGILISQTLWTLETAVPNTGEV
jgi:hypothetical protein